MTSTKTSVRSLLLAAAADQVTLGGAGSSVRIGDIAASTAAQSGPVNAVTVDASGTLGTGAVASAAQLGAVQSSRALLAPSRPDSRPRSMSRAASPDPASRAQAAAASAWPSAFEGPARSAGCMFPDLFTPGQCQLRELCVNR